MPNTDDNLVQHRVQKFEIDSQLFRDDTKSTLAALQTQVRSIENDYTDLKLAVVGLDKKLDTTFQAIQGHLNSAIEGINNKLDERGHTNWSALGVMLTAFVAFVAFAYWPINTAENELKANMISLTKDFSTLLSTLPESYVSHKQEAETFIKINDNTHKINSVVDDMSHNYVNYREHERLMKQFEGDINVLRKDQVSRSEHEQHWAANKERFEAVQRQIDVMRTDFGGMYTSRDQLQRLQAEIDHLHKFLTKDKE